MNIPRLCNPGVTLTARIVKIVYILLSKKYNIVTYWLFPWTLRWSFTKCQCPAVAYSRMFFEIYLIISPCGDSLFWAFDNECWDGRVMRGLFCKKWNPHRALRFGCTLYRACRFCFLWCNFSGCSGSWPWGSWWWRKGFHNIPTTLFWRQEPLLNNWDYSVLPERTPPA